MEFCSEIAVLQSAVRFATVKLGHPANITEKSQVDGFTEMIVPAITEIVQGLDEDRTLLDKNVWTLKILSFLLSQILKERLAKAANQNEATAANGRSSIEEEAESKHVQKNENDSPIFQHIPCLSFQIFMEIVNRFKWHQSLLECLEVLVESAALSVISDMMGIVNESQCKVSSLYVVLTCLKYVAWLIVKATNEDSDQEINAVDIFGSISSWLGENLIHLEWQKLFSEDPDLEWDFNNILILFLYVFVSDKPAIEVRSVVTNLVIKSDIYPCEKEATRVFRDMNERRQHRHFDASRFKSFLQNLQSGFIKTKWFTIISCILQNRNKWTPKETLESHSQREITLDDSREVTLDIGLLTLNMEDVHQTLLESLNKQDSTEEEKDLTPEVTCYLKSVVDQICHQRAMKQRKEEERKGAITLHETLHHRLQGYEEKLEKILTCYDLSLWKSERYAELLRDNCDLFFRDSQIRCLHQTLKSFVEDPEPYDKILEAILQVLLTGFSKLPILAQEKIIVDNCLSKTSDVLAAICNFNQEMNVVFNQSTSEVSGKQVEAVLRLFLIDPVSVVTTAVTAAIKGQGQCLVIIKIFRSVPDLCRCFHGNFHSERSLLCHVMSQYLLENRLSHKEEKNLINFVTMATQNFTREICGYKLEEAAILSPEEFASAVILPFIGVESRNQPISTEFALKLFICLLEQKKEADCDWLERIQLQTVLLCLCELLHHCVALWDTDSHLMTKYGVKQLCLRCLFLLQTKCSGIFTELHSKAIDWLKSRTKELDWSVQIHLQKTLSHLCASDEKEYKLLVETVAQHVIKHTGSNYIPLLRFVSISEETMETAMRLIENSKRVISPDNITHALAELMPNLLVSEWRRVVYSLVCLIDYDKLSVNYILMFCNKIVLSASYDVKCLLTLSQLLTSVVMVTACNPSAPADVVHHVATCYITILQEQSKSLKTIKDRKTEAFVIGQMFCHVTAAMATLDLDQSETLFVLLLKLLERFIDLQTRRVPKGSCRVTAPVDKDIQETEEVIFKAVSLLNDESKQETLLKKLLENKSED